MFQNFKTELENMIFINKDLKKSDFSITDPNLNISYGINNQSSNALQPIDTKKEKDPQSSKFKSSNQVGSLLKYEEIKKIKCDLVKEIVLKSNNSKVQN